MNKNILISLITGAMLWSGSGCQQGQNKLSASATPTESETKIYTPSAEEEKSLNKGVNLMLEGKTSEGLMEFTQMLSKNPGSIPGVRAAAEELLKQDRPEDAIKVLAVLTVAAPEDVGVLLDFAMAANGTGQQELAVETYTKALSKQPDSAEIYYARAVTLGKIDGRRNEAIADFNKAIEIQPDFTKAYTRRGILYAEFAKDSEAMKDFNKAVELSPDDTVARLNRAKILAKDKTKIDEALKDLEVIIDAGKPPEVFVEASMMKKKLKEQKK